MRKEQKSVLRISETEYSTLARNWFLKKKNCECSKVEGCEKAKKFYFKIFINIHNSLFEEYLKAFKCFLL